MSKNTFLLLSLFLFFRPLFACTKDNFVSEKGIVVEDVDVYPNDGEEAGLKEIKEIKGWFDFLCSPELGGRYSGSGGIEHAVGYIASIIGESDSLTVYSFDTDKCPMKNIVFHIEGDCDSLLVFGAHYDAYGYYTHTPLPGADDNLSYRPVNSRSACFCWRRAGPCSGFLSFPSLPWQTAFHWLP